MCIHLKQKLLPHLLLDIFLKFLHVYPHLIYFLELFIVPLTYYV